MKACFVQIGFNMTIQYKVLFRYLEENLDSFTFDHFIFPGQPDLKYSSREGKEREAVTVQTFEYIKTLTEKNFEMADVVKDYDIVFISFSTKNVVDFTLFCQTVKRKYNKPIIVGGGLTTYFRDYLNYMLDKNNIDHYVIGSGEKSILNFMIGKELPEIIIDNEIAEMYYPNYFSFENGVADIYAQRGCPFGCNFCYESNHKFKNVKVDKLSEWIERIYKDHGITKFRVSSAQFYTKRLFKKFFKQNEHLIGKISFDHGFFNPNDIDKDVIQMIEKLNFNRIGLGVESFSDRLLELMGKRNTVDDNIRTLELIKQYNIQYWPERMYGLPTETWSEFKESEKLFDKYGSTYGMTPDSPFKPFRPFFLKNTFRLLQHTEIYYNPEKFKVKLNFYDNTKILKSWTDLTDEDEFLFKEKVESLQQWV